MTARLSSVLALSTVIAATGAAAAPLVEIGTTVTVRNSVMVEYEADKRRLDRGDQVHQNEAVQTSRASLAEIRLLDETKLAVGPESRVVLDTFVYDARATPGTTAIRMAKGAFRFISGNNPSSTYQVQTPIASIGVRGTIFDLLVQPDRIVVILISGQILVTTLQNRTVSLIRPGTSLTVYLNGRVVGPTIWRGTIPVDFASASFPYFPPVTNIPPKPLKASAPVNTAPARTPPVRAKPVNIDPAPPHRQRIRWGERPRWRERPERVHQVRPRPPMHYPQHNQNNRNRRGH